jgi:hypothetical protein
MIGRLCFNIYNCASYQKNLTIYRKPFHWHPLLLLKLFRLLINKMIYIEIGGPKANLNAVVVSFDQQLAGENTRQGR